MRPTGYPVALILFSVLGLIPARARAQQTGQPFQKGTRAISLGLNGGGTFEVGEFTSPKHFRAIAVGLDVSFAGQRGRGTNDVSLSIGPRWKLYMRDQGPVAPYLSLGADIQGSRHGGPGGPPISGFGLDGVVGLGVDWFPASRVSIGGYTGASLFTSWAWNQGVPAESWMLGVGTLTTGLDLQLYF